MKNETKIYIIGSVGLALVIVLGLVLAFARPRSTCPVSRKRSCSKDCDSDSDSDSADRCPDDPCIVSPCPVDPVGPVGPCPKPNCKKDCPADCGACDPDCQKCPAPCPVPPKVSGVAKPESGNTTSSQRDAVEQYITGLYPLMPPASYNPDFWKTLDFFYNTACSTFVDVDTTGKRGDLYISDDTAFGQQHGHPVFRYFMQRFDDAGTVAAFSAGLKNTKWILFSPPLTSIPVDAPTAGFSYEADETKTAPGSPCIAEYNLYLKPLCSFRLPNSMGAVVQGVSVNRYPAGHLKAQGIAYAASNTGNDVIMRNIIPGVDQVHISAGFKSYSLIEIEHCDTGSASRASAESLPSCLNTCHVLASKCPGRMTDPTSVGFGKWLYYSRGSGIWVNLGKTAVFQNKIDAIRGSVDGWDGKNRAGNYVNQTYRGEAQGKYSNWSALLTWQNFVRAPEVRTAILAILDAPCNSRIVMDLLDASQEGGACAPVNNYLDLDESNGATEYSGPQCASQSYCNATKGDNGVADRHSSEYKLDPSKDAVNTVALWWFWAILTNDGKRAQGDWGVLSPIAPVQFTDPADKLGWLLWVCTNGYDFSVNPNNYSWGPNFTRKYLNPPTRETSDSLNRLIGNMGNSGFATDDIFIMYANYMQLDSIQLTTSAVVGNLISFELLTFTGSQSAPVQQAAGAPWQCTGVAANTKCVQDRSKNKENWIDTANSSFFIADPTNVAVLAPYAVVANGCTDSQYGTGYYLAATSPSSHKVYAYYDNVPISYPYTGNMIASCKQPVPPSAGACPALVKDIDGGFAGSCDESTMTPHGDHCVLTSQCKNVNGTPMSSSLEFRKGQYIDNQNGVLTCYNSAEEWQAEFPIDPNTPKHAHVQCT
jgi:hypothetical protein